MSKTTYLLSNVDWDALPAATVGRAYSGPVTSNLSSYYSTVVAGLPAGLRYDQTQKRIVGTPTKAGTFTIRISLYAASGVPVASQALPLRVQ